jgi:serine/threonine protein kinase
MSSAVTDLAVEFDHYPICIELWIMAAQETLLNNRYRLVAQQGSGGMAVIYKAIDQVLGRMVAVKILRPSLITDPSFLERFRNEARSVAKLTHPNIVTVHDVGQDGNTHYIVMEFVEGRDLKKLIRTEAPFSIERALNIAIQICAGVGYAHRSGLVHADVKPQNVLVSESDIVKVTDFGIAQALSDAAIGERQKVVWGSPHYFSPEQAQGERPTPASDVYSIGVVLFEMLTGRLPFIGADQQELAMAHIRDVPPRVSDFNPSVPIQLEQIIQKVLSKEPASRYRTADQLGRILISYRKQGYQATGSMAGSVSPSPQVTAPAPTLRAAASPPTQPSQSAYAPPTQASGPGPQPYYSPVQQQTPPPYPAPAYSTGPYRREREREERPVDLVTIVLALIALLAVLGLIPLWLDVFRAWLT